ncbi:MAG: hypothetical protein ABI360_03930 [Allobranchiibius sp.]
MSVVLLGVIRNRVALFVVFPALAETCALLVTTGLITGLITVRGV